MIFGMHDMHGKTPLSTREVYNKKPLANLKFYQVKLNTGMSPFASISDQHSVSVSNAHTTKPKSYDYTSFSHSKWKYYKTKAKSNIHTQTPTWNSVTARVSFSSNQENFFPPRNLLKEGNRKNFQYYNNLKLSAAYLTLDNLITQQTNTNG